MVFSVILRKSSDTSIWFCLTEILWDLVLTGDYVLIPFVVVGLYVFF